MKTSFSTIEDVWDYLDDIPKFQDKGSSASNFALEKITQFCSEMGNPQDRFPSIHVAGTNGKGTTCHLLEHVYQNAGYRTGLFTSPHLLNYNERFRVGGENCKDELIIQFFNKYSGLLEQIPLTYFEISTALAFWLFDKEKVDIAIIETGLGGRLDSTNIIHPLLSIITSIGLDHTDILGNSLEQIAAEKAGIIKKEVPVILGNVQDSLEPIFEQKADELRCQISKSSELRPKWNAGKVIFKSENVEFQSKLLESVNTWNYAMVYQAVDILQRKFPVQKKRLKHAFESFKGAFGRFEKLSENKDWYFSGAHNEQALRSTLATVENISEQKEPKIIFSLMKDKLNAEFIELMKPFKKKYYVQLDSERTASSEQIKSAFNDVEIIDENSQKSILKEFDTSLVIFAGSFYFYSTVRRWVS